MKSKLQKQSPAYSALDDFQRQFVQPKEGRTLIVGSQIYRDKEDRRKRYQDVVGVDLLDGPGVDMVLDMEEVYVDQAVALGMFHHVECMSVLEHSRRPWLLAENIQELLVPGGTLFVTVPLAWRIHGYPDDYWRITPSGIRSIFPNIYWQTIKIAADKIYDGPKWPVRKAGDYPFIGRAETCAFGVKK